VAGLPLCQYANRIHGLSFMDCHDVKEPVLRLVGGEI
jgi:hypothetical protein